MSKILNSVLDRVSENNNEYRGILRELNVSIDEKTTTLIGDVVTLSSYTADFSNTLTESKEKLVNPISRIIESYVIKDLRSVETVNEQFVEKINDKLDNANITSEEEKETFSNNLNMLLNDKYLEIVKIKRVDFFNAEGKNENIEQTISEFINYLNSLATFDFAELSELFNNYKEEIYKLVSKALKKISDLYLNNFVSEVSSALNVAVDFDDASIYNENTEEFKPYIPEINPIPENVIEPELENIPSGPVVDITPEVETTQVPFIPEIPTDDIQSQIEVQIPEIPVIPMEESDSSKDVVEPMEVSPIAPIEIKEEPQRETTKRSYDVEEILKIAKSPIVSIPEKEKEESYLNVSPIESQKEAETMESEFNEKEIVEEMIRRLSNRLSSINERTSKYDEEKAKLEEDEAFVNDLIESSNVKKQELDKFESELDEKQKELDEKQKELDKKINDVMPFANALLNAEKES